MASEDLTSVIFNSGRLVKNPTNLALAYPYGGTELGLARDVVVVPSQLKVELTAEEFGRITVDVVDVGRSWVLGCNLRGWDNDAINTIFPGVVSSGAGIKDTLTAQRGGALLSSRSCKLLFVPDDTTNHRMVYLYRALPLVDESAELALQLANEHLIPCIFMAIPDTSGRIYSQELLSALVL